MPLAAAYVTNLAVDGRFRRRGIAAAVLHAGERIVLASQTSILSSLRINLHTHLHI